MKSTFDDLSDDPIRCLLRGDSRPLALRAEVDMGITTQCIEGRPDRGLVAGVAIAAAHYALARNYRLI